MNYRKILERGNTMKNVLDVKASELKIIAKYCKKKNIRFRPFSDGKDAQVHFNSEEEAYEVSDFLEGRMMKK